MVVDAITRRADVLAEVLRQVALVPSPVNEYALFTSTQAALDVSEEEFGGEFLLALFLLTRLGVIVSNTYDPREPALWSTAGTTFTASQTVQSFIWGEE